MNVCIFRGNISSDVVVRYSQSKEEQAIARFSIAVNNPFSREGKADFFNCICLNNKTSQFIEKYFQKGQAVVVRGRLTTNNYSNKAGEKVYSYNLIVEEVDFANNKEKPQQHEGFCNDHPELPFN